MLEKVCPYLLRGDGAEREILAFRHPLAGCQLIKGTREADETVESGALREFGEESGLSGRIGAGARWTSADVAPGQLWHFVPVAAPDVPDAFEFDTLDDGGHRFAFFWWRLSQRPGDAWHEDFARALAEIRAH